MLLHWIWIDLDMEKYDKILRKCAINYFVVCVSFNLFTFTYFNFLNVIIFFKFRALGSKCGGGSTLGVMDSLHTHAIYLQKKKYW